MFRNCKPQCKFKQMGPLWAWWADISSKMLPKAGGRPGEDRGRSWGAFWSIFGRMFGRFFPFRPIFLFL